MKDTKIQWHPGFVAAMNLEFAKDRERLIFEKEYNLNTKPLEIDLLVIKKDSHVQITNETGRLFKGHNILEYRSPEDHLDIDSFYKAGAYASLYKAYGETVERKADDITVSMVRETKPDGLFQYFSAHQTRLEEFKGEGAMCQALLEIMEPEIEKIKRDEAQKGHIYGAISMCRDLGLSDDVILKRLQEKYHLSWKEAEKYLQADS